MKPVFPRINKAIEFTLEYHTEGRVIEYLQAYTRMAKGYSSSGSYLVDNWEDLLYTLHRQMENEILQTVYTSNQNTQVIMFEELREWINADWRLGGEPNISFFWSVVDKHNEKVNSELEEKLAIEVSKFQSTVEFKTLGQNEEYEKTIMTGPIWSLGRERHIPYTEKRINRKYYCNDLSADFLDYFQLKKYSELVKRIVDNFRGIVQKHLSLFDSGKYVSLQEISIQKEKLRLNPPEQNLIEVGNDIEKIGSTKMLLNLSVPQLVALFMALREMKIINEPVNTELARFIKAHFSTKGSQDISEKGMLNQFGNLDVAGADYWLDKLKEFRIVLANLKIKD